MLTYLHKGSVDLYALPTCLDGIGVCYECRVWYIYTTSAFSHDPTQSLYNGGQTSLDPPFFFFSLGGRESPIGIHEFPKYLLLLKPKSKQNLHKPYLFPLHTKRPKTTHIHNRTLPPFHQLYLPSVLPPTNINILPKSQPSIYIQHTSPKVPPPLPLTTRKTLIQSSNPDQRTKTH